VGLPVLALADADRDAILAATDALYDRRVALHFAAAETIEEERRPMLSRFSGSRTFSGT
jgi:hypothetical protein